MFRLLRVWLMMVTPAESRQALIQSLASLTTKDETRPAKSMEIFLYDLFDSFIGVVALVAAHLHLDLKREKLKRLETHG